MTNETKKDIAFRFVSSLVAFSVLVLIVCLYLFWGLMPTIGVSVLLGITVLMCKWLSLEDDPPKEEGDQDGN